MATDKALRTFDLRVIMDGQPPVVIEMDQRDQAAFELEEFGVPYFRAADRYATYLRWTAWHAMVRLGKTKLSWAKWTKECKFVAEVKLEEAEAGGDPLESGPPAVSDET